MTITKSDPAEGSIQWAMNRGKLFQVNGIYRYGQLLTNCETALDAARAALVKGVPNGTILTVYNVYGGSISGFCMKDAQRFVVRNGEVLECQG